MNDLTLFGKALSDPTRIRIISALRQGELCVCELCDAMEVSQSTLSTHLQVIRQAQLVTARKEGKWIYYDIDPTQIPLIEAIFSFHKEALAADKRLQRDAQRLHLRLTLREEGACIVGSEQVDSMILKANGKAAPIKLSAQEANAP